MRNGRTGTTMFASALALAVALTAGCTSSGGARNPAAAPRSQGPVAKVAITPADGTKKVAPDTGVSVKVTDGKVTRLAVADSKGREVSGAVGADGAWRPQWPVRPSTAYTVSAQVTGTDGKEVTTQAKFTTLKPKRALESGMSPLDGEKVGVGMPVQLLLSRSVTGKEERAAIERAPVVEVSEPAAGA